MPLRFRELTTPRLLLRAPREADAPHLFAAFQSDPEVTRYLSWRPHQRLEQAEAGLAARLLRQRDGREHSWILCDGETGTVLGIVSAWPDPDASGVELGFALARAVWNRGLASEAVRAVVDWAFSLPDVGRVWATCDEENRASARVLEKAGLTCKGPWEHGIVRPNLGAEPRPSLLFELRPPEGVRAGAQW